jgi:hypothetical protein
MSDKLMIFQTPQVAKLLRADRFTLNRLMIRGGIKTSFGSRGQGSQLLFTVEDVAKAAIAYWLFRSGLRTPAIKQALAQKNTAELCKKLTDVGEIMETASKTDFLITWRLAKGAKASQEITLERSFAGLQRVLENVHQYGFVVVPIGRLLRELAEAIRGF